MLAGLSLAALAPLLAIGLLLDALLGEARRFHPLVGFGHVAHALEVRLNRGRALPVRGALAWLLAVLPPCVLAALALVWLPTWAALTGHVLLLYFALGLHSLRAHTRPIATALTNGQLAQARALTARIVSRDTAHADPEALAKAGCESVLENGSDAVIGTLFWFVIAGGPGALLFRLANTLDAMWGYRNARFARFGTWAARADDILGYLPARLCALGYALLGATRPALACWRRQAPAWPSPNAGPVMASGAGALRLQLGGAASYDGVIEHRPPLGIGRAPDAADLTRAWRLVALSAWLWPLAAMCAAILNGR